MQTEKNEHKSNRFTRTFFEQDLVLSHRIAQQLHKRFYDRIDHSFFVSMKVLRRQHRDTEAQQIETAVQGLCDKMEYDLTQASERIVATFAKAQMPSPCGHSDITASCKAEYSTGYSFRLLDLFSRFDRLLMQIEALELHNLGTADECTSLIRFWHGEFHRFLNALTAVRSRPDPHASSSKETPHDKA